MKILKFNKVNQLLVIAAKGDDPVYQEKFQVKDDNLCISFIEYVKSQLHINVVTDFFGRNIFAYLNTYKFLRGENILGDEALKVLQYFYEDIAYFLIKNPINLNLSVSINEFRDDETSNFNMEATSKSDSKLSDLMFSLGDISEWEYFSQVETFLKSLLETQNDYELFSIIQESEYSFILDYVLSLDDIRRKLNSYVLATSILSYLAQGVSIQNLIEFHGGNYEKEG